MSAGTVNDNDAAALGLLHALRLLAGWATSASRTLTGNPYCAEPVIHALKTIQRAEGTEGHWTDALKLSKPTPRNDCDVAAARREETRQKEEGTHPRSLLRDGGKEVPRAEESCPGCGAKVGDNHFSCSNPAGM